MSEDVSHETLCSMERLFAQIEQRKAGERTRVQHRGRLCSKCYSAPPAGPKVRYCHKCHADYERERRIMLKERNEKNAAIAAGVAALLENQNKLSKGTDNGQGKKEEQSRAIEYGQADAGPSLRNAP